MNATATPRKCDLPACPVDWDAITPPPKERPVALITMGIALVALLSGFIGYAMSQAEWKGATNNRLFSLEEADKRLQSDLKTQTENVDKRLERIEGKIDRIGIGGRP